MITRAQFCSVTGHQQEPPVPIHVVTIIVVIGVGIVGFVLVYVLVCLARGRQSQLNGYTLHAFPPGTVVTVHPHPDPDRTALVSPPASPPTYEPLQAANGDGGVLQLPHGDQSSDIFHKSDDP